jgi:thiol-disulfide isomerase/thioredoxin
MRALAAALMLFVAAPGAAASVTWTDGDLAAALQLAKQREQNVLVEVWAEWCNPCKKQAAEVFESDEGAALTRDLVAWRVDFDAEATRPLMERWSVLSLPTILFLRADGSEIDRIEGYDDKKTFLQEARVLAGGQDPLPTLVKKLQAARKKGDDKARLTLLVDIGHRRLVRGQTEEGLYALERAVSEDAGGKAGAAEHALFLLGRYYSRVKRDFATSRHVWRELYTRFPEGDYANTAAWWYVGALHELKQDRLAVDVLARRTRARPTDVDALDLLISFVESKGVGGRAARRALGRAKAKVPADAWTELDGRLRAAGDKKGD